MRVTRLLVAWASLAAPAVSLGQGAAPTPTRVRSDLGGATLAEAVDRLGAGSGLPIRLHPDSKPADRSRRLAEAYPAGETTFWEAVDRLARRDRLAIIPRLTMDGGAVELLPVASDPPPSTIVGPFHLALVGLVERRTIVYGDPREEVEDWALREPARAGGAGLPPVFERSHATLRLSAEPRPSIAVDLAGPPRVDEAVDDRGRSLVAKPPSLDYPTRYVRERKPFGIDVRLFLDLPVPPGRSIGRLRGVLPLVVWVVRPDRLEVDLAKAGAPPVRGSGVAIRVVPAGPKAKPGAVAVEVVPDFGPVGPPRQASLFERGPDRLFFDHQKQFELIDADGKPIPFTASSAQSDKAGGWVITLTPKAGQRVGAPARVRFRELAWSRPEVAFDFRDIPLP